MRVRACDTAVAVDQRLPRDNSHLRIPPRLLIGMSPGDATVDTSFIATGRLMMRHEHKDNTSLARRRVEMIEVGWNSSQTT